MTRTEHPDDRRAVRLEPTPAGRALVRMIEEDILEQETRLLAGFEPEARRSMARLIDELAKAKAQRIDTTGGTCCALD